jgi:hypothetical protein
MPATTGGSHALAAFATLIVGTMLSKYLWSYAPPLGEASVAVIRVLRRLTGAGIPLDEQFAGTVVVMVSLSFLWGVLYHVGRHG